MQQVIIDIDLWLGRNNTSYDNNYICINRESWQHTCELLKEEYRLKTGKNIEEVGSSSGGKKQEKEKSDDSEGYYGGGYYSRGSDSGYESD